MEPAAGAAGGYGAAGKTRVRLVRAVAALPDAMLDAGVLGETSSVRLGERLRLLGAYQEPRIRLAETLAALGWDAPAAVRHLQWAPIARARLEASLVGVPDVLLDGQPFPGEWSVRRQLAHVELTDRRYTIATAYAARRRDDQPLLPPPEAYPAREETPGGSQGEGLAEILARMQRVREEALAPLLGISDAQLLRPTEWHTAEHTLGFRLHRFAQHDLELTTDIQRTLAALGHMPTRAMRLAAALVEGWGELEATLLGVPESYYSMRPADGGATVGKQVDALCAADAEVLALLRRAGGP